MIGIASPLLSFGLTHMPPYAILLQTVLELAVYGFAAGILREKGLGIFTSLISAMVLGRLARIAYIIILGSGASPFMFLKISLPGIILQLALIPIIIYLLQKFVFEKRV